MLDFTACPVVDNHCHVLEPQKQTIEPLWLAREFFHGMADTPTPGVAKAKLWGATDDRRFHFPHMGVVLTAVCQLAKLFGCSAELEVVTSERNRRTAAAGLAGYAKWLYDDARIVPSVRDSGLPIQDPILDLTPARKLRLLQMDPIVRKLVNTCGSYAELLRSFQDAIERPIRQDGFVGIKAHPGELVGLGAAPVETDEAERIFPVAQSGEGEAFKKLYMAVGWPPCSSARSCRSPSTSTRALLAASGTDPLPRQIHSSLSHPPPASVPPDATRSSPCRSPVDPDAGAMAHACRRATPGCRRLVRTGARVLGLPHRREMA